MNTETTEVPITDVVFDMCGVLVDWRPELALEGQYPREIIDMVLDPRDEWGFEYFDAMVDSGWSEERVLREYERHHGPAVAWVYRTYFNRLPYAMRSMIPGMEAVLYELHDRGVRLWGLTNFTTEAVRIARRSFPALGLLRDIVVSAEERVCKPDPIIFQRAIARFGLNPAVSLFVDDNPRNTSAARREGMQALTFVNAQQVRRRIIPETLETEQSPKGEQRQR